MEAKYGSYPIHDDFEIDVDAVIAQRKQLDALLAAARELLKGDDEHPLPDWAYLIVEAAIA